MAEVLRTGRLPNNLVGVLSARLRVTDADGGFLPTELRREGGIHTFLGHLTAEAAPFPGLVGLTLIGVDRAGVSHILHSFFSVPVRPFDPNHWLFGCREDITSEGPPVITEIYVASFTERHVFSAVSWEYHIVHLDRVLPSIWKTNPCERASGKAEGQNLTCRGLTFIPPDAAALLLCMEGNVAEFSRQLFPRLAS